MATNAAIYVRISDDRTGARAGVERQRVDCEAKAKRLRWNVVAVLEDNDISAFSGKRRPDYERLVGMFQSGEIDAVIVWHPDRIYRRSKELVAFLDVVAEIEKDGREIRIATCQAGDLDLTTSDGRLMARIGVAVAEHESEHKAARVRRANRAKAEQGLPRNSNKRFGYTPEWKIDRTEARIIRKAIDDVIKGRSVLAVWREWMDKGIPSPSGNPYTTPQAVKRVLRAPYVAGLLLHQGEIVGPGKWEPIVEREKWERAVAILNDERRKPKYASARVHVLTGFIYCGKCGSRLHGGPKRGRASYSCKRLGQTPDACQGISVRAEEIEAFVGEEIAAEIISRGGIESPQVTKVPNLGYEQLATQRRELQAKRERLVTLYEDGNITYEQFNRRAKPHDAEIAKLSERMATPDDDGTFDAWILIPESVDKAWRTTPGHRALAEESIRIFWRSASLENKRKLLGGMVDRIDVHPSPGKRFSGDRIKITWR